MLPEATANAGYCVFSASREPYQNPKTTAIINRIIIAVWKYSFLQNFSSVELVNDLPSATEIFLVNYVQATLKLSASRIKKEGERMRLSVAALGV
jgi:hypothetical protein